MKRDRLTILRSRHGVLAKTIRRRDQGELEIIGFSAGMWFSVEELEIGSLDELITTLDRLQEDRRACLVRGSPLPTVDRQRTRRLLYPDPQTDAAATFGPAARQWLLLDIDGLEEPAGLDFRTEPEAAVEHAIGVLLEVFHEASCWWQATGSAGIKPGIRLRLAFWLSRPLSDQEARAWLRGFPCDLSLYSPVQPHYVARPVLQDVPDPMLRRSGRRSGLEDTVAVPDVIESPVEASSDTGAGEGLHEARGFEGHLQRLGDGDGLLGFKSPLTSAIASYVAEHGAEIDAPALKARLREAIDAAPKRPGRTADIARYRSDRWLDDLIRWVIDRERQRPPRGLQGKQVVQPPRGPPSWITEAELPPDVAAVRLRDAITAWGREALDWRTAHAGKSHAPPPPHAGIKATTGLGKTRLALQVLAAGAARRTVHYYVPTLALAEEVATEARTLGINAMVLRGREALILETDETMCAKADVAKILGRHGLPVWEHLCQRKDKDAEAEERCEHYDTCPYVAQFVDTQGRLIVLAHEYLTLPKQRLASPGLVVIDERFYPALIRHSSLPVERLAAPKSAPWFIKDEKVADHLDRAAAVRQALLDGKHVRESGVSCEELKAMAALEMTFADIPRITPSMHHAEQRRRADLLAEIEAFRLSRVWRLLAEDYDRPQPSQRVVVRRGVEWHGELQDRVFLYWRAALQLPLASAPVLLLDADLDPLIVAKVIPLEPERIVTVTARLNAEVVQVWDTACSRKRLLGKKSDEEDQRRAGRRRRDVMAVAAAEAFRDRGVLLGTYKPVVEALERMEGVDLAWFGAIRGIDRWRDRDTIVVAGREQPPPGSIETQARAWFGDDLEPLLLTNDYVEQCRGYRMRDGSALGAIVHVHPDLRCQALLEQAREREMEQMVGRLRLVHRRAQAKVIHLSNLPTGLAVDRLAKMKEIVPDRLSQAIVRGGGVLPLSAGELAQTYPDLWPTQRSAQHWLGRQAQEKGTQTLIRDSYWEMGTLSAATLVSYRRPGQSRGSPHQALLPGEITAVAAAEDRLSAVLGEVENICLLEVLGRPEPRPAAGAGPAQVIEDEGEPPLFYIPGLAPPSHRYIVDVFKIGKHMVLVTAPPPATMQRLQAA